MNILENKHIIVALTGGIACYKTIELVRLLRKNGANINIVMTKSATNFITPLTMEVISGSKVFLDLEVKNHSISHINLTRHNDLIIIAPTTANFIAKLAHGIADDFLSTLSLARSCPMFLVPAMNKLMWDNKRTKQNVSILMDDGIKILGPNYGEQACGELGEGRMLEPSEIFEHIINFFSDKILNNLKILITSGPTIEPIDPIRFISNHSSGKTGYAIAKAAQNAGALVTVITGPTKLKDPKSIHLIKVITAKDMYNAVMEHIKGIDIFISVAAVTDWFVSNVSASKIKKNENSMPKILLSQNIDILQEVSNMKNRPFCIGFAAETNDLEHYAKLKRENKKVELIVGNIADKVMNNNNAGYIIFDKYGKYIIDYTSKDEAAIKLIRLIANKINKC